MPPDDVLSWPGVADHQIGRVPEQHLTAAFYLAVVVLAVAVLVAAGIWLRRWLPPLSPPPPPLSPPPPPPALTAEAVGAELQKVLKAYINGDLREIKAQLAELDRKQDEHSDRLARVETLTGSRPPAPHHVRVRGPR